MSILSARWCALLLALYMAACGDDAPDDGGADDATAADAQPDANADAGGAADIAVEDASVPAPSVLDLPFDEDGPFPVGYRTWETSYSVPGTGEDRRITVHAWYPAAAAEGSAPRYLGVQRDADAYTDAPVAEPMNGESYPVHVYSHGDQAYAGSSAFLMRYFASHGWLVVAPDHVGNLLTDNSRGETDPHWVERPFDITATLDAVQALPDEDPLSRADTSRVVLSGHSRGAYTVWSVSGASFDVSRIEADRPDMDAALVDVLAAGVGDDRVVASIPLAGSYRASWFGDDGWQTVEAPVLFLTGSNDGPESMRETFERAEQGDIRWVELEGGCHQTFALGACETLSVPLGFDIVEAYAMAFARHEVLGDTSDDVVGVLDGTVEVAPEARMELGAGVSGLD